MYHLPISEDGCAASPIMRTDIPVKPRPSQQSLYEWLIDIIWDSLTGYANVRNIASNFPWFPPGQRCGNTPAPAMTHRQGVNSSRRAQGPNALRPSRRPALHGQSERPAPSHDTRKPTDDGRLARTHSTPMP